MKRRANGEGSVFWSDSFGRYVAQATLPNGRRKSFFAPRGDRSRAAKVGVQERLHKYVGRRGARGADERLQQFTDHWIETASIRSKTRQFYEWIARTHIGRLGALTLADIEPRDIRSHLDSLDVGDRTRQAVYGLIRTVLAEAVALDILSRNPAENVKRPKLQRREMRALAPEEVALLLRAVHGDRLEALVVLALTTTMGPGELFALRRRDIHISDRHLIVAGDLVEAAAHGYRPTIEPTKNPKRRRRIDLPKIAVDALRERLKLCLAEGSGDFVFTSPEGAPIRLSNLHRRWWKPLLEKTAGLAAKHGVTFPVDLRLYDLRHTANALMGLAGISIEVARDRMGHSSIKTTVDVYGHLYASRQRDAAAKIDVIFGVLLNESLNDVSRGTSQDTEKP